MEKYVVESFVLDDLGEFDGVHIPSKRWNGWACPLFTLDTCREIARAINSLPYTEEIIRVTDSQVFCIYTGNGEEEIHEVEPLFIAGADFFPLGSGGWVWDIATD